MNSKKIFKPVKKFILLFLLLNVIFVYYGKIQCNRMLDAINDNDIKKLESILNFASPNTVPGNALLDVFSENADRRTPLGAACEAGNFEMVKLLVRKGADVNYTPLNALISPLGFAVKSNNVDNLKIVKFLIENGANANHPEYRASRPARELLFQRKLPSNGMELLEAMLEAGAGEDKERLLQIACGMKHEAVIKYLIEKWECDASDTLFLRAYCSGGGEYRYDTFEYFLKEGADPYEKRLTNKYRGEKSALDCLKEKSPEWAEKLIKLAAGYGFEESAAPKSMG